MPTLYVNGKKTAQVKRNGMHVSVVGINQHHGDVSSLSIRPPRGGEAKNVPIGSFVDIVSGKLLTECEIRVSPKPFDNAPEFLNDVQIVEPKELRVAAK
ncbi:MAG: hypothetical protein ABA06_02120 [Parcubacteria bacterium C7867-001]|nr:MAG: hypothetical protein ABA06_02120 [Parcubacteria bacterium C7867-001]